MGKEKIHMEYMLNAGSANIVWSIISTPSGLETWFADRVSVHEKIYTFQWGKAEKREAEIVGIRQNSHIRFHWLDDEDKKTYFELRMIYNELTEDLMLEITDWAEPDEIEDQKDLWDSDIEKMRRVSGL
jgi:uncharacterized protein YndB with AHSA1/START domain